MEYGRAVVQAGDNSVLIPVGKSHWAIVDTEYAWLSSYAWHTHKGRRDLVYACHSFLGRQRRVYHVNMHHFVLPALPQKAGIDVDHKDGNSLNNRRSNLRHVTHRENAVAASARRKVAYREAQKEVH